jgi:hypothetical protein
MFPFGTSIKGPYVGAGANTVWRADTLALMRF